jgi:hypothetical protein
VEQEPVGVEELPLSEDALREALRERVEANAQHPRCDDYFVPFGKRAETLESEGNVELAAAFRFLGIVTSQQLKPDNRNQPFQSLWAMQAARPPIVDEITDAQIEAVALVVADASDPELRARLADVAWIRNRDHRLARVAISAYLEAGDRLLADPLSPHAITRFERALQIAASFFKQQPVFEETLAQVTAIACDDDQPPYIVAASLDLLLQYESPDPEKLARIAQSRATCDESKDKPLWQRRFWEHAARFFEWANRPDDANRARTEVALTFEREADEALRRNPPSYLTASKWLHDAVQSYRRVSGADAECGRVHLQLVEYQKKARKELVTCRSGPIDLSKSARSAEDAVRGKPLLDGLRILSMIDAVPSVAELRSQAEQKIGGSPIAYLFPASTLSATGKVVAKHGTMASDSQADRESLILREMFWFSSHTSHPLWVVGQIEPMRQQILADHCVRYADMAPLVTYNPLVPPGRERFYIRGLHAGLHGDFVESIHLLIPQLENSIRSLLLEQGIVVSSLDTQGLQQENNLNSMLYEPRLNDLFGEDTVFQLRGLLVEQASSNLRNRTAHGMIEYGEFFGYSPAYAWWLILRLCVLSTFAKESP